ncbi:MAG: TetR/AcrR family transcriptional regulator [Novosphingobium sp.]
MASTAALAPRKAPAQARSRATQAAIVEAAARVVAARGLAGFTTNAVAERAGVSIGSLYQYFPNKDALMLALIERQQAHQADRLEAAAGLLERAGLPDAVRALVRAAMQHHRDDALLASAIDHEEARLPAQAAIDAALARGGEVIAMMLRRHADAVGPLDPARAARTLPALVRGVVDAWANLAEPDLAAAEDEAVRAVLGYLRHG